LDDPLSAVDAAVSRHLFDRYRMFNVVMDLGCYWCYDYKVYVWSVS